MREKEARNVATDLRRFLHSPSPRVNEKVIFSSQRGEGLGCFLMDALSCHCLLFFPCLFMGLIVKRRCFSQLHGKGKADIWDKK